jgi:hypothetical protein
MDVRFGMVTHYKQIFIICNSFMAGMGLFLHGVWCVVGEVFSVCAAHSVVGRWSIKG